MFFIDTRTKRSVVESFNLFVFYLEMLLWYKRVSYFRRVPYTPGDPGVEGNGTPVKGPYTAEVI